MEREREPQALESHDDLDLTDPDHFVPRAPRTRSCALFTANLAALEGRAGVPESTTFEMAVKMTTFVSLLKKFCV